MAVREEPWTADLDLTVKEKLKIGAGAFIAFLWMMAVLAAIFIAGASHA